MPVVPCPTTCTPPTKGVVQFDPVEFVAIYPEFAGLTNPGMAQSFVDATLLLNNNCNSTVFDADQRLQFLYTLTAHCLLIDRGTNDGAGNVTPPQGIVGRIDTAAEGSVSVGASYNNDVSQSEAYFIQTKYGAKFWQQTAYIRTATYIGPPSVGPNGPGFPWLGDGFFGVE